MAGSVVPIPLPRGREAKLYLPEHLPPEALFAVADWVRQWQTPRILPLPELTPEEADAFTAALESSGGSE